MKSTREHLRCYVAPDDWQGTALTIADTEAHHLVNVLRAHIGERVEVFDGSGRTGVAQLITIGKHTAALKLLEQQTQPRPTPELILVQALPREATMDFIVQKAVELGVATIFPVLTERCIVRLKPGHDAEKRARWQRIALNAARQSQTAWLMHIAGIQTLGNFFHGLEKRGIFTEDAGSETRPTDIPSNLTVEGRPGLRSGENGFDLWFVGSLAAHAQPLRVALAEARERIPRRIAVLIGPEGDLTPAEHHAAEKAGAVPVSFGQSVLRVDTAAFYAISAMKLVLMD